MIQLLDQYTERSVIKEILYETISLLQKLHILGYYHGDLHLGNIMVDYEDIGEKIDNESERYRMRKHKFYLIDFGLSNYIPNDRSVIIYNYQKFF